MGQDAGEFVGGLKMADRENRDSRKLVRIRKPGPRAMGAIQLAVRKCPGTGLPGHIGFRPGRPSVERLNPRSLLHLGSVCVAVGGQRFLESDWPCRR